MKKKKKATSQGDAPGCASGETPCGTQCCSASQDCHQVGTTYTCCPQGYSLCGGKCCEDWCCKNGGKEKCCSCCSGPYCHCD